ncbi:MAG: ABC transporter permease, partial [Anaerolineales bacterium]
ARIRVFGLPAASQMYAPELQEGRWLSGSDRNAAVISSSLAADQGWQVGEWVTIKDNFGIEEDWQIIGITYDPLVGSAFFVPIRQLQRDLNQSGMTNTLWMRSDLQGTEVLQTLALDLAEDFDRRNFEVASSGTFGYNTINEIVEQTQGGYSLIFQLLAIMAVIVAVVGGVGLSGVLTLNVIERRREIGVMRSIGASTWRVVNLSIGEGVLLGWLSWLVALPLSIPAAYLLATRGLSFALNQQLSYRFSLDGALLWLVIITILAVVASSFPARSAARVSVRESLTY